MSGADMVWNTREIARLAGTSSRTVRHYHEIGLLAEPERLPNGYHKVYRTEHLLRLVQIRRLKGFGFSLNAIATMEADPETWDAQTLNEVEADLKATISALEAARDELTSLRQRPVPIDMPYELSAAATDARLSPTDRRLLAVFIQLFGEDVARAFKDGMSEIKRDATSDEFDALPPDADEETRERVAQRLAAQRVPAEPMRKVEQSINQFSDQQHLFLAVAEAVRDIYNPAQIDVLIRLKKTMDASRA